MLGMHATIVGTYAQGKSQKVDHWNSRSAVMQCPADDCTIFGGSNSDIVPTVLVAGLLAA